MTASYSRVLNLQRNLYQAGVEYLEALENAQTSYVVLDGFVYSGGLDSCNSSSIRLRSDFIPMNSFVHWFTATYYPRSSGVPCRLRLRSLTLIAKSASSWSPELLV